MSGERSKGSDDRSWPHERDYSTDVARALQAAEHTIARADASTEERELTYSELVRLARQPMSQHQRQQAYLLATQVAAKLGEYDLALQWSASALDLALYLADGAALIHVHQERAAIFRATSQLTQASDESRLIIKHIYDQNQVVRFVDVITEARVLAQWSGYEYMRGNHPLALELLDRFSALLRMTTATEMDVAPAKWIWAHIAHDRGELGAALEHAIAASDIFSTHGAPSSASRIAALVAEIALDLCEARANPASAGGRAFFDLGGAYIRRAVKLAPLASDPGGNGLALLQRARYDRLRGRAEHAITTVESVARSAHKNGDIALLAQAYSSLAYEFDLHGEADRAFNLYSETLDLVAGGNFTVLGRKAQRAILRASEMGRDVFA